MMTLEETENSCDRGGGTREIEVDIGRAQHKKTRGCTVATTGYDIVERVA